MKKVMIIGCSGAGKSVMARKLGALTGLPVIHLDQHHWLADWCEPSTVVWRGIVEDLDARPVAARTDTEKSY